MCSPAVFAVTAHQPSYSTALIPGALLLHVRSCAIEVHRWRGAPQTVRYFTSFSCLGSSFPSYIHITFPTLTSLCLLNSLCISVAGGSMFL
jgi:hypothetical protein